MEGDDKNHPNLRVNVKLIHCDTNQEMEKHLTGSTILSGSVGNPISFGKLKVLTTSHQQGGSQFALKFELREEISTNQLNLLHSVQSTPFTIFSHCSLLQPKNIVNPVVGINN